MKPYPDYLYVVQQAERDAFGPYWLLQADSYQHNEDTLVAVFPDPKYWPGHEVRVYCSACMQQRTYTMHVHGQGAAKPIVIECKRQTAPEVARLARLFSDGNVIVTRGK